VKVLEVVHGYPPRYNAGSEIYTQTVSHELVRQGCEVSVFCREEDPYRPDFDVVVEKDTLEPSINVFVANHARSRDRYKHDKMDDAFKGVLDTINPDVVHVNHLNHLSTGIVDVAYSRAIPVVFTLHDFWLPCPRGQFLQMALGEPQVYPECPGQDDHRCAVHCMSRMWGGVDPVDDESYWTRWVQLRMREIRRIKDKVSFFISPSLNLKTRLAEELGIGLDRIIHEPYGFDLTRLAGRKRDDEGVFVFGYIGRIDFSKGLDLLLKAYGSTNGPARLRIWGRQSSQESPSLKRIVDSLPPKRRKGIEWLPEYRNEDIIQLVFNRVDAIVVPSIWDENSPLVIQEALQARVPVVTSEKGGMGELIRDGVNGFTFKHRSVQDLTKTLQRVLDDPATANRLAQRGYLPSSDGSIHRVEDHAANLLEIFRKSQEGISTL
jgi:glycosyltransferase involved in cell wall biosynthesis